MKASYEKYILKTRNPERPIHPIILNRHSPRIFSQPEVTQEELETLFEAARWAPSSSNTQPWRFIVSQKGTSGFEQQVTFLDEFNHRWAPKASYLITVISQQVSDDGKELRHASFDTGAAWENLALQASDMDIVAHAMGGFDSEKARAALGVPDTFRVECMIAIGRRTALDDVPEEFLQGETPKGREIFQSRVFVDRFGKQYEHF